MKFIACKLDPARLPATARANILKLLKKHTDDENAERIVLELEKAAGYYDAQTKAMQGAKESGKEVRDDLQTIRESIAGLRKTLSTEKGSAYALLAGEAARLGVASQLMAICDAFDGVAGDALEQAAEAAADGFKVERKRPSEPDPALRAELRQKIRDAGKQIGIEPARKGDYAKLVEFLYCAIGIDTEVDGDIKNCGY